LYPLVVIYFLILNQSRYMCSQGFYVFTGCVSPIDDIGGVASLFQWVSSGGDRGSRMLFAGEHGGGRNATAAKSL